MANCDGKCKPGVNFITILRVHFAPKITKLMKWTPGQINYTVYKNTIRTLPKAGLFFYLNPKNVTKIDDDGSKNILVSKPSTVIC